MSKAWPPHRIFLGLTRDGLGGKGGEGDQGEAGPSSQGEVGASSQACATDEERPTPILFAPIALDDFPLRTTPSPEALMFSRTPSPTAALSPPSYSE